MSRSNPILAFGRISEKLAETITEWNVLQSAKKQEQIEFFKDAHLKLYKSYQYWQFGFGIAGGVAEMAGAPGAGAIGSQLSSGISQSYGAEQPLANRDIEIWKKRMDESSQKSSQAKELSQRLQQITNSIIESLTRTYTSQLTAR